MNKTKILVMLSLFAILMTVFGSVYVQDNNLPAFKISSAVTDEKVILTTRNFPADTAYTVSMADPADPDHFTAVAKFNSKTGGSLNVTVKIPDKFKGLYIIDLMLQDESGAKILGNFINDPAAEPVEEPAEEPAPEEPAAEPAPEETITLVNQQPVEEPAPEEPTEEVIEKPAPAEEPAEEPVIEEPAPAEEPAEEPVLDEPAPAEAPAEEPVLEEPAPAEGPVEEVAVSEAPALTCDYTQIPTVSIDAVTQNKSVTFTTANFPANSTFSVSMGVYVSSWTPDPMPAPGPHSGPHSGPKPGPKPGDKPQGTAGSQYPAEKPQLSSDLPYLYPVSPSSSAPVPGFKDIDAAPAKPGPKPHGTVTTSFSGIEVGTFNTGDGSPQTLTFEIPESLAWASPIALWINDLGPCGFYSYNYFWNATTNW